MQDKFRLYRRPNGMLYAEECGTRHRESLQTKNEAEAPSCLARSHSEAGVSTNVFLRILHNRAVDLAWIVQPVILKKAWPKIVFGRRNPPSWGNHRLAR
jgi:hypothetical protein